MDITSLPSLASSMNGKPTPQPPLPEVSATVRDHQQRLARAVAHLEQHLDDPLDVRSLARVAAFSEFHFHRVFRALVGESVMGHVRRLRLERAARELRHGDAPVIDVAAHAGFEAHEAFTRAFSAHFGLSPSAYRKAHEQGRAEAAPSPVAPDFAHLDDRDGLDLLAVRHVGPYTEVGRAFGLLYQQAVALGVVPGSPLGLCWDDPEITDPTRFRFDACMQVTTSPADVRPLERRRIEGGRFAVALHHGPYTTLTETYARLVRWMLDRDLEPTADPSIERYLVGPTDGVSPDAFTTEVALRVDPRSQGARRGSL